MIDIITKDRWQTTRWSGGETNEIFIYPQDGNYSERNFTARISVANTATDALSPFTGLPGVNRFISVLEGQMRLIFKGRYEKVLGQYEIENFDGDWQTCSTGKYTDFNFMIRNGRGALSFRTIDEDTVLETENGAIRSFIFVVWGSIGIGNRMAGRYDLIVSDEKQIRLESNGASFFYGFFV